MLILFSGQISKNEVVNQCACILDSDIFLPNCLPKNSIIYTWTQIQFIHIHTCTHIHSTRILSFIIFKSLLGMPLSRIYAAKRIFPENSDEESNSYIESISWIQDLTHIGTVLRTTKKVPDPSNWKVNRFIQVVDTCF